MEARQVWEQIIAVLAPSGVLSKADQNQLARYCDALVRWKKVAKFLQEHGEIYTLKDNKGVVKCVMPYPHVSIYQKLADLLQKTEDRFGLSPSARTRIQIVEKNKPVAKKSRFFGGPTDSKPPAMKLAQ